MTLAWYRQDVTAAAARGCGVEGGMAAGWRGSADGMVGSHVARASPFPREGVCPAAPSTRALLQGRDAGSGRGAAVGCSLEIAESPRGASWRGAAVLPGRLSEPSQGAQLCFHLCFPLTYCSVSF